MQLQSVLGLLI